MGETIEIAQLRLEKNIQISNDGFMYILPIVRTEGLVT